MSSLTDLDVSYCYNITDVGVTNIKDLPQLERLYLEKTSITDAALVSVGGMSSLTDLDVCYCEGITNEGLDYLQGKTKLNVRK
jgi:hypothetical protein